jgi:hypothetical protein
MSAYGAIAKPATSAASLAPTSWACKPSIKQPDLVSKQLTIHHLTLDIARSQKGLIPYLREVFVGEIEAGRTYPQETMQGEGVFEAYFFSADVFLAIVSERATEDTNEINAGIEDCRNGRDWEDCVAGFYYVSCALRGR